MSQPTSHGPLWRMPTVAAQVGLSIPEIYRRIRKGTFPKPVKLGARAVAWPSHVVIEWMESLAIQVRQ